MNEFDFQTPVEISRYMASLIPAWAKTVLEPTPGIGNLVRACEERGLKVTAPKDFFLLDTKERFDCVIMNPPFSVKYARLENAKANLFGYGMRLGYWMLVQCMHKSDRVIALMPWNCIIDSDKRTRTLKHYGIRSITHLPRQTFPGARVQCCVFELVKGYSDETVFKVYDMLKPVKEQKQLFEQNHL